MKYQAVPLKGIKIHQQNHSSPTTPKSVSVIRLKDDA